MNPLPYLPAFVAALAAAALCGVAFTITFTAWMLCDPLARRGPFRPRLVASIRPHPGPRRHRESQPSPKSSPASPLLRCGWL